MPKQQPNALTAYTQRLIIVVRAALQPDAEAAAIVADPEGGAGTFVPGTPLRVAGDATNTVVAYWTGWTMTPEQRQRLSDEFGRRAGSFPVIAAGGNVNKSRQFWAFEASDGAWTGDAVLAALGYAPLASPPLPGL